MQTITFTNEVKAELVTFHASDIQVARAAWVSIIGEDAREKESGRVPGLIDFLWRNKHTSPFEHGMFTFWIHVPLFVAREYHRHRTWSYNEESGRYKVLDPVFYLPDEQRALQQVGKPGAYEFVAGTDTQYQQVKHAIETASKTSYGLYQSLLASGVAKEVARMVLPVNIFTSFYATVDPLNLMRFLTLRTDSNALWEIRSVANQVEAVFAEKMPITHAAWKKDQELWKKFFEWLEEQEETNE